MGFQLGVISEEYCIREGDALERSDAYHGIEPRGTLGRLVHNCIDIDDNVLSNTCLRIEGRIMYVVIVIYLDIFTVTNIETALLSGISILSTKHICICVYVSRRGKRDLKSEK